MYSNFCLFFFFAGMYAKLYQTKKKKNSNLTYVLCKLMFLLGLCVLKKKKKKKIFRDKHFISHKYLKHSKKEYKTLIFK